MEALKGGGQGRERQEEGQVISLSLLLCLFSYRV